MSQKFFGQKKNERANNLAVDEDKCKGKNKKKKRLAGKTAICGKPNFLTLAKI